MPQGMAAVELVTGAATRSLLTGTDFGDNILADLPSVIGRVQSGIRLPVLSSSNRKFF
jgi:hypothetical protein